MRACDRSSIFSTGRKFRPDCGLLLELHALTLVARSYALLPQRKYTRLQWQPSLGHCVLKASFPQCKYTRLQWQPSLGHCVLKASFPHVSIPDCSGNPH